LPQAKVVSAPPAFHARRVVPKHEVLWNTLSPRPLCATSLAPSADDRPGRGEVWSVYYADLGEAVTYCRECAEREEFGEHRA
jgi:hypothetical protein